MDEYVTREEQLLANIAGHEGVPIPNPAVTRQEMLLGEILVRVDGVPTKEYVDEELAKKADKTDIDLIKTWETSQSFYFVPADLIDGALLQGMKVYGNSEERLTYVEEYEKFRVSYKEEGAEEYTIAADNITGTAYTLDGLTNGTFYDLLLEGYYDGEWEIIAIGSAHPVASRAGSSGKPDAPKIWISTHNHQIYVVNEARTGIVTFARSYKINGSWSEQEDSNRHLLNYNVPVPDDSSITDMLLQIKGPKWSSSDAKYGLRILDSEYNQPFYVLSDDGCAVLSWSTCFGGCQCGFMSSRETSPTADLKGTTAFVITTGMPLRKLGDVCDILDLEAGTVIKNINERGDAVLATPTVVNLTNDEKAAWKTFKLYKASSLIQASNEQYAAIKADVKYLSNATELGKAVEALQTQITALQA